MGLSCVVSDARQLTVVAEWGRYAKADVLDDGGISTPL